MPVPFSHFIYGDVIEQDESHIQYRLTLSGGRGIATVYPIMSGIEIVEMDFHGSQYMPLIHKNRQQSIIEINHCLESRAECQMSDGCLQYIGEGDLFLNTLRNHSDSIELPLDLYHGIAVIIDLEQAAQEVEHALSGIRFRLKSAFDKFFVEDECFLIQAKNAIQWIFSGMYAAPQESRNIYYRLKVLELFLFLHYFDVQKEPLKTVYARQQIDVIKQIHKQITNDPRQRFTIDELAKQYCVSATTLKAGFKAVYGESIAAYMKEYRIQHAANQLRNTQKSVAEISAEIGYGSQSKFGVAFKDRMGVSPLEYRKKFNNK